MNWFLLIFYLLICLKKATINLANKEEQCSINDINECNDPSKSKKYSKEYNEIWEEIEKALRSYKIEESSFIDNSTCKQFVSVIELDLAPYRIGGITKNMIKDSEPFGTLYKIVDKKLYRSEDCMFPVRCAGVEHFLLQLLPELPDLDLVINTRDYPQLPKAFSNKRTIFSFSKTREYADIMYPAWTFWAGGPAISLFPTGIGRWDLLRENIMQNAEKIPWSEKQPLGFFRGSRTSDERDALVLLSRRKPELVDAKFTKNQAWKSAKDTLYEEPATEVSFEAHCQYKYLFNFRGVAASFRFKHLFLCNSLVLHVGAEWQEFFYLALKPWVHYVPLDSYPTESELEKILLFFREHDDLAQQIAQRGYEFIRDHLKMSDVQCYWRKLLLEYKKLLNFTVTTEKNLKQIKN